MIRHIRPARVIGLALVGAVVATSAACTSTHKSAASPSASVSASASASAGSSSGSTTFPGERAAAWQPCPSIAANVPGTPTKSYSFDCAVIPVPQDWHHADNGKTINIAMLRIRSNTQTGRIGSLVVNPGGPGGSGIELALSEVAPGSSLPKAILDKFDIVGFDPRGVGFSTEVQCVAAKQEDAVFGADPDPQTQADFDAVVALNKAAEAPCGAKYGATLPYFSTEEAARDMDAIRVGVGDPKLTYLGYSYGTLLGATYAQLFPDKVRALVLDGPIDPTQDAVARSEGQAAGFTLAFNDFATWCKANPSQCAISADPLGAVQSALASARTVPLPAIGGRKATAGWVLTGVIEAMYSKSEWASLGTAIADLKKGDSASIMRLADQYAERRSDGTYSNLFDDNDAVNCADFASQPTLAQVRAYQLQWRAKWPLFGGPIGTGLITCAQGVWPGTYDPYPTGAAVGAPPIVVIGTTGDPATPVAQAGKLSDMLGVGHVVIWNGEGHTAYPQTPCITNAVNAYLINLTVPPAGLTCPAS